MFNKTFAWVTDIYINIFWITKLRINTNNIINNREFGINSYNW